MACQGCKGKGGGGGCKGCGGGCKGCGEGGKRGHGGSFWTPPCGGCYSGWYGDGGCSGLGGACGPVDCGGGGCSPSQVIPVPVPYPFPVYAAPERRAPRPPALRDAFVVSARQGGLNLRAQPTLHSALVSAMPNGTRVKRLGRRSSDWWLVSIPSTGQVGYALAGLPGEARNLMEVF